MQSNIWLIFGVFLSCFIQPQAALALCKAPLWNQILTKGASGSDLNSKIGPYLLPSDHPVKKTLDLIFQNIEAVQTDEAFIRNGFQLICNIRPFTFVRVARHSLMPGYVFKFYPENECRKKKNKESWQWLILRCRGAENIRRLIQNKKLRFFTAPKKWVYKYSFGNQCKLRHPLILVAEDMKLVSVEDSEKAWKKKASKKHLDELYEILSHGYSSCYLPGNIPYSRNGVFSCIDTEHPKRKINYATGVKKYFTRELQAYWDKLVRNGGARKGET